MSQQQVEKYLPQEKAKKELLKLADSYYITEHFNIKTKYDKSKFIFYKMVNDMFCTDDCQTLELLRKNG